MTSLHTYLAAGQRYAQPGGAIGRTDRQVVVSHLDRDPYGIPRVTFRCPDGRELVAYAAQVEEAVAAGELSPVVGAGAIARC